MTRLVKRNTGEHMRAAVELLRAQPVLPEWTLPPHVRGPLADWIEEEADVYFRGGPAAPVAGGIAIAILSHLEDGPRR